jgi:biopolymer transport protein ExbD
MAMSTGAGNDDNAPMSDINTTPLVDIMLVLLIIFLIAVPVAIKSVEVELPDTSFERTDTKAENVQLTVRAEPGSGQCGVYWNGVYRINSNDLYTRASAQFQKISKMLGDNVTDLDLFPEVHIRGDRSTPYRCIGGVISVMQSAGFLKIGFISEPGVGG